MAGGVDTDEARDGVAVFQEDIRLKVRGSEEEAPQYLMNSPLTPFGDGRAFFPET